MHREVLRSLSLPFRREAPHAGDVQLLQFGCLQDNYGYLLRHQNYTIAIDVPDGARYVEVAKENKWDITHCLLTHHHFDHAGGVPLVRKAFDSVQVFGSLAEQEKLPPLEQAVEEAKEGQKCGKGNFEIGDIEFRVLDVPGHTLGHIAYYLPKQKAVFVGDAVFVMGCGRIFEGTPAMMFKSVEKIKNLPEETHLFCAHEYTEANGRFALSVDTQNQELNKKLAEVSELRQQGKPTVPSTIDVERKTNPFFRAEQLAATVGAASELESFTKLRERKDCF